LSQVTRQLFIPENKDGQFYAIVNKLLGNRRIRISYIDPKKGLMETLAIIGGGLKRKKQWVKVNNYIVISLRDFEESKCDVIHVYNDSEMNELRKYNYIPKGILNTGEKIDDNDMEFNEELEDEYFNNSKSKISNLSNNKIVKENYGIISSDEEEDNE
jgi:translation initiation factor 1A